MFRFLFRFAGLVVIAFSFLFVVYDGTKSIADQTIYISRVGPTWVNIHPSSLSAFEPAVENASRSMGLERCSPAIFSGATDCTRPSHHWCPPGPAWEQEEAADRLCTGLTTTGPLRPRVESECLSGVDLLALTVFRRTTMSRA